MELGNYKYLKVSFTLFFCLVLKVSISQNYHQYNNAWLRLIIQENINNKWQCDLLLQNRRIANKRELNVLQFQQLNSFWFSLNYLLNEKLKFSFSPLCYFETKSLNNLNERGVKEWRWTGRLEHYLPLHNSQLINRFGIEYRYRNLLIEEQFIGNFRLRYLLRFLKPLGKINKKMVNLVANDEILIQYGEAVKDNLSYFDQNRIYLGVNFEISSTVKMDIAYQNVLQFRALTNDRDIQHAICIFLSIDKFLSQIVNRKN